MKSMIDMVQMVDRLALGGELQKKLERAEHLMSEYSKQRKER